jgi:uncharacterized protein (TIGR03435 family)
MVRRILLLSLLLLSFDVSPAPAQGPAPAPPQFVLPPMIRSVRAAHRGTGMIDVQQDHFPAEITLSNHGDKDWAEMAQVTSRTLTEIKSVHVGWAYVLPAGLDFHQSELITPPSGIMPAASYQTMAMEIAPRADAKDLLIFVEQTTLKDGTVSNADHSKIAAFYTSCCSGANKGKIPPEPMSRVQQDVPGGTLPEHFKGVTANLKPITFDVISFRKAEGPGRGREFPVDGDFISYHGSTIDQLLIFAYGGKKGFFNVVGEPEWARNEFYEFTAKVAPEDIAQWKKMTLPDKRLMVGAALEDVLKLKIHDDTSEHPVYDLVVAKGGSKLIDYQPGDTITSPNGQVLTGKVMTRFDPFYLVCQDETMADLVNTMSGPDRVGRVVIDKTGLTGNYDFSLPYLQGQGQLSDQIQRMIDEAGLPSVFEGLKQLGLQLVPSKGAINGIMVDHIERPPDN